MKLPAKAAVAADILLTVAALGCGTNLSAPALLLAMDPQPAVHVAKETVAQRGGTEAAGAAAEREKQSWGASCWSG